MRFKHGCLCTKQFSHFPQSVFHKQPMQFPHFSVLWTFFSFFSGGSFLSRNINANFRMFKKINYPRCEESSLSSDSCRQSPKYYPCLCIWSKSTSRSFLT